MLKASTFLFLTLSAQEPPAPSLDIIIWGGGRTVDDGKRVQEDLKQQHKDLGGAIRFAEGFPSLVESKDVAGLNPGFFIVVAGYCGPEQTAEALKVIKSVQPGAYAKRVQIKSGAACPTLASGWELGETLEVRHARRTLRATVMSNPGGFTDWRLLVELHGKNGLIQRRVLHPEMDFNGAGMCEPPRVTASGARLVAELECRRPQGCPQEITSTQRITLSVDGDQIGQRLKQVQFNQPACSGE